MTQRRVCITGIGIVSPLGNTREETWRKVLKGESGADYIKAFDAETWPTTFACEVKDFVLSPDMVKHTLAPYLNRAGNFAAAAAHEAIIDSGILGHLVGDRFGVAVGANIGAVSPTELYNLWHGKAPVTDDATKVSAPSVLRNHPGTLAAVLSAQWGAYGPIATVHTACASSGQSLGQAFRMLQRGDCDTVLAGGADSLAAELLLAGFCLIGALSRRNLDPKAASRPFDKDRDGFVAGEGAAMLMLEELGHAKARGARIYAELAGYGETESAYRITDLPPDGTGIVEAMHTAVAEANLSYRDIHYINAHGTSTEVNDRIEALAVRRVFADKQARPMVSSTKSGTGHLISAAGALELAFCALSIRDSEVPPTRNLYHSDCGDLDFVAHQSRLGEVYAAMSNSIGFGGSNSSLIVRKWEGA